MTFPFDNRDGDHMILRHPHTLTCITLSPPVTSPSWIMKNKYTFDHHTSQKTLFYLPEKTTNLCNPLQVYTSIVHVLAKDMQQSCVIFNINELSHGTERLGKDLCWNMNNLKSIVCTSHNHKNNKLSWHKLSHVVLNH